MSTEEKPAAEKPAAPEVKDQPIYKCGALTYTKMGLIALFCWLLWGDFCYSVMELMAPHIVPLQLRELDAPNWVISLFIAAIPNILNLGVSPYVHVRSDRCRSRWGRRIPFIAASIPFISLNLCLLAFSGDIAELIHKIKFFASFAPTTVLIFVIGVAYLLFQLFNLVLNTGFLALFNDVVPPTHLARFFGYYRMIGTVIGAVYNFCIFRYSLSHFRELFWVAALVYFIGFTLLIFHVKEGKYPPLDENQRKPGRWAQLKVFFQESFHEPLYRLICYSAGIMAFASVAWSFNTFYRLEMKLTLDQLGKFNGILSVGAFCAMYFAAVFVDRWHPMRVYTYGVVFCAIGPLMNWVWVFIDLPGIMFFWLSLASAILYIFVNSLSSATALPKQMRLFPKSRYGQFCSAQGILASLCRIVAGFIVGFFYDGIRWLFATYWHGDPNAIQAGSGYCYRFYFVWASGACIANFVVIAMAYRRWLKLGGDAGYHPPASWNDKGYEENELVPTTGISSKYLRLALVIYDMTIHGSLLLGLAMIPVLTHYQMPETVRHFWLYVVPLSALASVLWFFQARGIRRDIRLAKEHKMPVNGIPHHGMLLVFAIKFFTTLGLVVGQFSVAIFPHFGINNGFYALIFALSNITTNFLIIICIFTFQKMEKGYSTKVDEDSVAVWKELGLVK